MTDRSKLLALAEAVEKLTGPDRVTDARIAHAVKWRWNDWVEGDLCIESYTVEAVIERVQKNSHNSIWQHLPRFTASLDAAMTLVTGHAVLMHLSEFGADGLPLARVGRPDLPNVPILPGMASCVMTDTAPAAGMAIALTAAALRAQGEALA